jgi:GMP synthase (glutamine-hydrolysing)
MQFSEDKEKIIIVDFGSQVTKLIARRVRDLGVYSEIVAPYNIIKIKDFKNIKGIIFSGGPSTVTRNKYQSVSKNIFDQKVPILGICYGLQLIAKLLGGKIKSSKKKREFGRAILYKKRSSLLTSNYLESSKYVWMSHEDVVVKMPKNFSIIASTKNSKYTIIENKKKKYMEFNFIQK